MKRFLFLILFIVPLKLQAAEFSVVPGQSSVVFTSEAPMETVRGETEQISGTVSVNPPSVASVRAKFSVQADTLKTGNRLRDRNMRNNFLETGKFPEIIFTLRGMSGGTLVPGRGVVLKAVGVFTLHGVVREINIPVTVSWDQKEDTLRVQSKFSINLSDYQIERPRILILRLSDTVEVNLDLMLSSH